MHGYFWGYRGIPRTGNFSCLNYFDSPLGFWVMATLMIIVTVAIVLLLISARKKHRNHDEESEALAIIKRRYAIGELTTADFSRMKKDLL